MLIKLLIVFFSLFISGCVTAKTIDALAKDNASICIKADAFIYGKIIMCRSNHDGAAMGIDKDGNLMIQHAPK